MGKGLLATSSRDWVSIYTPGQPSVRETPIPVLSSPSQSRRGGVLSATDDVANDWARVATKPLEPSDRAAFENGWYPRKTNRITVATSISLSIIHLIICIEDV